MPGPSDIQSGVINTVGLPTVLGFSSGIVKSQDFILTGVTRDASGAVLGGCTVHIFISATDILEQVQISDPTTGVYSVFVKPPPTAYYGVAYKAGSPDVAGTTLNTLTGV